MINHQLARARVADNAARAERLASNRQLLAFRPPLNHASPQRWRTHGRTVSGRLAVLRPPA